ncbi:MAG: DUF4405 domain-containing protein [Planctomycetes bacterium]|jgi:hypothetical protein|nr:DUF4405 domain-containing protein [Planctomycetota bacterium]
MAIKAFLIFTLAVIILPGLAYAWEDCPFNEVNEPYPGTCGRYLDTDGNGICDHSEPAPNEQITINTVLPALTAGEETAEPTAAADSHGPVNGQGLKALTVAEAARAYGISAIDLAGALMDRIGEKVRLIDTFQYLHDQYGLSPSLAKETAASLQTGLTKTIDAAAAKTPLPAAAKQNRYNFLPVAGGLVASYLISLVFVKKRIISRLWQRRFWNIALLISFFGVGLSGLFLVIKVNYGWTLPTPFNLLYWHVEIGITMAVITIFHIIWHWPYFKCFWLKKKTDQC